MMNYRVLFAIFFLCCLHAGAQDKHLLMGLKYPQGQKEIDFAKSHRIKSIVQISGDTLSSVNYNHYKITKNYNADGLLTSYENQHPGIHWIDTYKYNKDGRLVTYIKREYNTSAKKWILTKKIKVSYHKNGLLKSIKHKEISPVEKIRKIPLLKKTWRTKDYYRGKVKYSYHKNENKLAVKFRGKNPASHQITYFYSSKNELVKEVDTSKNGWRVSEYIYDDKGNRLKETGAFNYSFEYGNSVSSSTYSAAGNPVRTGSYGYNVRQNLHTNPRRVDTTVSRNYTEYQYDDENREVNIKSFQYDTAQQTFVLVSEKITTYSTENGLTRATIDHQYSNPFTVVELSKDGLILYRHSYNYAAKNVHSPQDALEHYVEKYTYTFY